MPSVRVSRAPLGSYETNCYIVRAGGECWVVDPGEGPGRVIDMLRGESLVPSAIVLTHAHVDHIAGLDEVRRAFESPGRSPPVLLHPAEHHWLCDPTANLSALAGWPVVCEATPHPLEPSTELHLGGTAWRVLHTPGHSPGGVTLVCEAAGIAVVGDTLFAGSIGRVDLPGSDPAAMRRSLQAIMALPDRMAVLPGHGPETTIGRERDSNPFLTGELDW